MERCNSNTQKCYPYIVIEKDGQVYGYAYAGAFVGRLKAGCREWESAVYGLVPTADSICL